MREQARLIGGRRACEGVHILKDPFSIEGKVTIVTGGGTGIGESIAKEFAARGARVMVASRKVENLERVRDEIKKAGGTCEVTTVDVRDAEQCEKMVGETVRQFGRLDVLINNHGASITTPTLNLSPNGWRAVVGINLDGVFFCTRAAVRVLIPQKSGGSIINISSTAGVHGSPTMLPYGASKAGVINLTTSHAGEFGEYGIRVNCIAPGPIDTEGAAPRVWPNPAVKAMVARSRALRRFGRVEEIAYPCIFLASDAASYVTGALLIVDGGAAASNVE
jgi:NAD(P)-dependent dehydrogenase (short-subunit alcohol dehydrogenase family)